MLPYTPTDLSRMMRREFAATLPRVQIAPQASLWQQLRRLASYRTDSR